MKETGSSPKAEYARGHLIAWGVCALLFGLGIFLRSYNLDDFPAFIHNDESAQAIYVIPTFFTENPDSPMWGFNNFGRHANFGAWLTSLSVRWFGGQTLWAIRLGSAICGILSILFFALFTRSWLGLRATIFFLAAVAPFHLHVFYSRTGFHYIQAVTFGALVSWLFARLVSIPNVKNALFLGVALGFALMVYSATLVVPAALAVGLVPLLCSRSFPRSFGGKRLKGLGVLTIGITVGLLLSMGQHLYFIYKQGFSSRLDTQSILHRVPVDQRGGFLDHLDVIWVGLKKTLWFFYYGDAAGQYGYLGTPLEVISYGLAAIGILALLYRCARFDPMGLYILALGVSTVVGSSLMIEANFSPHLIIFALLIPLLCAMGADVLFEVLRARSLLLSAAVAVVAVVPWTVWNYQFVASRDARKMNLDTFTLRLPIDRDSIKTIVNFTQFYGDVRETFYRLRYPNAKAVTVPSVDVPAQMVDLYVSQTCPCLAIAPRASTQAASERLEQQGRKFQTFAVPRYEADVFVLE